MLQHEGEGGGMILSGRLEVTVGNPHMCFLKEMHIILIATYLIALGMRFQNMYFGVLI